MQKRENAISEALVAQFLAADVLVIGAPLYNFAIPTQLKAWIDRVAQVGRTFTYTDKGPVGMAGGKTVIIASTRGGVYSTSDAGNAMEHQESYGRRNDRFPLQPCERGKQLRKRLHVAPCQCTQPRVAIYVRQ